jgi:predicted hotdog family 3-hydroxylacyl-ACP dehydratase
MQLTMRHAARLMEAAMLQHSKHRRSIGRGTIITTITATNNTTIMATITTGTIIVTMGMVTATSTIMSAMTIMSTVTITTAITLTTITPRRPLEPIVQAPRW